MNYFPKLTVFLVLLILIPSLKAQVKTGLVNFDKAAFFKVIAGNNLTEVNSVLTGLNESSIAEKTAYEGALLMKKAGLVTKVMDKLGFFKAGRKKLESAIKNEESNAEYRFLRLIIQENAPKIVHYKGDIDDDAELVRSLYKKLPLVIQAAVKDYSKRSSILKSINF